MSTYAFLSNNLKQTLVYYPIPKNANTSAKYFIIKHCEPENQFNVPSCYSHLNSISNLFVITSDFGISNFQNSNELKYDQKVFR